MQNDSKTVAVLCTTKTWEDYIAEDPFIRILAGSAEDGSAERNMRVWKEIKKPKQGQQRKKPHSCKMIDVAQPRAWNPLNMGSTDRKTAGPDKLDSRFND